MRIAVVILVAFSFVSTQAFATGKHHVAKPVVKPVVEKPVAAVTGGGASGGYLPLLIAGGFFTYIVWNHYKCLEKPQTDPCYPDELRLAAQKKVADERAAMRAKIAMAKVKSTKRVERKVGGAAVAAPTARCVPTPACKQ